MLQQEINERYDQAVNALREKQVQTQGLIEELRKIEDIVNKSAFGKPLEEQYMLRNNRISKDVAEGLETTAHHTEEELNILEDRIKNINSTLMTDMPDSSDDLENKIFGSFSLPVFPKITAEDQLMSDKQRAMIGTDTEEEFTQRLAE